MLIGTDILMRQLQESHWELTSNIVRMKNTEIIKYGGKERK
jgi:hypothetical protein